MHANSCRDKIRFFFFSTQRVILPIYDWLLWFILFMAALRACLIIAQSANSNFYNTGMFWFLWGFAEQTARMLLGVTLLLVIAQRSCGKAAMRRACLGGSALFLTTTIINSIVLISLTKSDVKTQVLYFTSKQPHACCLQS